MHRQRGDATQRAQEAVGLYGDPDSTWAIGLEATVEPGGATGGSAGLVEAAARLVRTHPHLGDEVHLLHGVPEGDWTLVRDGVVTDGYRPGGPLVRCAVSADGRRWAVGAHHGVCDGLGLLGLLSVLRGVPVTCRARGIGDRPAAGSFASRGVRRVVEALADPPPRFAVDRPEAARAQLEQQPPDHLLARSLESRRVGVADLALAASSAFADVAGSAAPTPLWSIGVSRRPPGVPDPDRRTAYLRLRVRPGDTVESVRRILAVQPPEPDFPATSARGLAPVAMRALRSRLGATGTLSTLGFLAADGLLAVAMHAATSGPSAVALGLTTTDAHTVVTARTRRVEFSADRTAEILDAVVRRLPAG